MKLRSIVDSQHKTIEKMNDYYYLLDRENFVKSIFMKESIRNYCIEELYKEFQESGYIYEGDETLDLCN